MKKIFRKIKNSWNENRVLFVLMTILVICLILILTVVLDYFLGTSKDKYGDRLEGIKKVEFTDKRISEIEKKIKEDEKVSKCEVTQIGKMIYVTITYTDGITLVEAEGKASNTLELFNEKETKFYDINYTLIQDKKENNEGFVIMGAKNVNGSALVWNNNTSFNEEE